MTESVRMGIELTALFIEVLAVAVMAGFIVFATVKWIVGSRRRPGKTYESYRVAVGKSLLLGLELLVAADIIRTVALDLTLANIATLGALVLVRTFLGWTLNVEVEGHWPWQQGRETAPAMGQGAVSLAHEDQLRED
jgi:uncharacterized membrane protein